MSATSDPGADLPPERTHHRQSPASDTRVGPTTGATRADTSTTLPNSESRRRARTLVADDRLAFRLKRWGRRSIRFRRLVPRAAGQSTRLYASILPTTE